MVNFSFYNFFLGDLIIFFPDIFWIVFCILNLCLGLYLSKNVRSLQSNILFIDLIFPLIFFSFFLIYQFKNLHIFSYFDFLIDNHYVIFRLLLLFFLFLCLITSRYYFLFNKVYLFEYSILLLLSLEGSFLMFFTSNLFVFFLALEVQNLCFYVLASLKRYNSFSTEAGLKYFLLGSFSSSLIIYGLSIVYSLFGTLNISEVVLLLNLSLFSKEEMSLVFVGFFFLIAGLLFKLGSAPFHWWLPDVYQGSPMIITMVFSVLPKLTLVFIIIKYFFAFFYFNLEFFALFFLICGFFSLFFGGLNALFQYNLKRFLAYSAIANVGYILLSFSLCNLDGFVSGFIYLFTYLFSLVVIFHFIINERNLVFNKIDNIFDFSLVYNSDKIFPMLVSLMFFSLAGIPPLMGFFGKFMFFITMANNFNYLLLFFSLILTIFISFYYIRIVRFMFFTNCSVNSIYIAYNQSLIYLVLFLLNILCIFFIDASLEVIYTFFFNFHINAA